MDGYVGDGWQHNSKKTNKNKTLNLIRFSLCLNIYILYIILIIRCITPVCSYCRHYYRLLKSTFQWFLKKDHFGLLLLLLLLLVFTVYTRSVNLTCWTFAHFVIKHDETKINPFPLLCKRVTLQFPQVLPCCSSSRHHSWKTECPVDGNNHS